MTKIKKKLICLTAVGILMGGISGCAAISAVSQKHSVESTVKGYLSAIQDENKDISQYAVDGYIDNLGISYIRDNGEVLFGEIESEEYNKAADDFVDTVIDTMVEDYNIDSVEFNENKTKATVTLTMNSFESKDLQTAMNKVSEEISNDIIDYANQNPDEFENIVTSYSSEDLQKWALEKWGANALKEMTEVVKNTPEESMKVIVKLTKQENSKQSWKISEISVQESGGDTK